jgi:predicted exporter
VRRIRPSLLLSAFTTTVAFLALALSDFPGLGDMGSLAAVGIPVSLVFAIISIPAFLDPDPQPTAVLRGLAQGFGALVDWLGRRRWVAVALCAAAVVVAAAGLPAQRWEDDPSALTAIHPELYAESERVRERAADFDGGRFVVALAPSAELALQRNDQIAGRLAGLVAEGKLGSVGSLHAFLWSEALQRRNLKALRSAPELAEAIDAAYASQGFRRGSFRAFDAAVVEPEAAPLRPDDLRGSPLERLMDSLVQLDGRWAAVTYLRGVDSAPALREALADLQGVYYIDQREIVAGLYEGYRRSTVRVIGLGSLLVLLVLLLRYRSVTYGLLAFLPSGLAVLATVGIFGLLGTTMNVVSAISLLVVLGIGVDYGIFAVDAGRRSSQQAATLCSLLIACLTSVCVFGLLGLAGQPVLRAIGLTTSVGVLLAFLLSPAALILARARAGRKGA